MYFIDALAIECDTDQLRMEVMLPVAEKLESAIVVTAAHSDAIALGVKSDQRRNAQIEFERRYCSNHGWFE